MRRLFLQGIPMVRHYALSSYALACALLTHVGLARLVMGSPSHARKIGANDDTPEITKVKLYWKMPLNIRWAFPVKIHTTSDNPLEKAADKRNSAGKCHRRNPR